LAPPAPRRIAPPCSPASIGGGSLVDSRNARDAATKDFSRYSLLFALPIYTFLLPPPCGPGIRSPCLLFGSAQDWN
jgi:hypothetical protein